VIDNPHRVVIALVNTEREEEQARRRAAAVGRVAGSVALELARPSSARSEKRDFGSRRYS